MKNFIIKNILLPFSGILVFVLMFSNIIYKLFSFWNYTEALGFYMVYVPFILPVWFICANIIDVLKRKWKSAMFFCLIICFIEYICVFSWPMCGVVFDKYFDKMIWQLTVYMGLIINIIMTLIIVLIKCFYNIYKKRSISNKNQTDAEMVEIKGDSEE